MPLVSALQMLRKLLPVVMVNKSEPKASAKLSYASGSGCRNWVIYKMRSSSLGSVREEGEVDWLGFSYF